MAKFCGKCGAKLDVTTGLCPNCDVDKLKKQSDKSEAVDVAKSIQEIAPTSEKPLSKKEAKKKRKADKKAAKKAKKKEKRTSMTFGQKVFIIILKFLLWLIILISFSIGIIGGLSYLDIIEIPVVTAYQEDKLLEFINTKNIAIEESMIEMTSDTEGTAIIMVKIPNYELLFKEAALTKNPEQYLIKSLALKKYDVQEIEASANITVENGSTIIHSDDVVQQLLDESLVNAINALSEVED